MVAFIWIACFFCLVMAQVLIKYQGVILGAIPTMLMYGFTIWLAHTLSDKWKKRKKSKNKPDESETAGDQLDIYNDPSIQVNYRAEEPDEETKKDAKVLTFADVMDADETQEEDEKMPLIVKVIVVSTAVCLVLLILISSLSKM